MEEHAAYIRHSKMRRYKTYGHNAILAWGWMKCTEKFAEWAGWAHNNETKSSWHLNEGPEFLTDVVAVRASMSDASVSHGIF